MKILLNLGIVLLLVCLQTDAVVWAADAKVGQMAPNFTLKSISGKNLRLSEYRGQVVMLNFWATWCGPCRQEMPVLNRLYARYKKIGFVILGINLDNDPAKAKAMVRKIGVDFPILFDARKHVSKSYEVDAMPSTVLVDRDGKVRYLHRGYLPRFKERYEREVQELLKQ